MRFTLDASVQFELHTLSKRICIGPMTNSELPLDCDLAPPLIRRLGSPRAVFGDG